MIKRFWLKIKNWFKRFWRIIIPVAVAGGIGAVSISVEPIILPDYFNKEIGCVQNINGDWVEFDLKTGKHNSEVQDLVGNKKSKVATTTPASEQESPARFIGNYREAPCVLWEGKALRDYSNIELERKILKDGKKTSLLIKKTYAAVSVNANTDKIDFGDKFDFLASNTFTIELWAKISATTGCDFFASKETNTAGIANWALFTFDCVTAGNVAWRIGGGNSAERTYCTFDRGGSAIDDGNWHHLAITHNNGTTCSAVTAYVDGISRTVTQQDTGSAAGDNTNSFCLFNACFGAQANGLAAGASIDEFRFWNYVRSAALIAGNMWLRIPDQEGLIGYWRTDEGTGATNAVRPFGSHPSSTSVFGTLTSVDWVDSAPVNYPE